MLGEGSDATAAGRALAQAEEAVDDAVRLLRDAEALHWTGPGAAGYRRLVEDATDAVRGSRADLRHAAEAAAAHAAARRDGVGGAPDDPLGRLEPRWLHPPWGDGASPGRRAASSGVSVP